MWWICDAVERWLIPWWLPRSLILLELGYPVDRVALLFSLCGPFAFWFAFIAFPEPCAKLLTMREFCGTIGLGAVSALMPYMLVDWKCVGIPLDLFGENYTEVLLIWGPLSPFSCLPGNLESSVWLLPWISSVEAIVFFMISLFSLFFCPFWTWLTIFLLKRSILVSRPILSGVLPTRKLTISMGFYWFDWITIYSTWVDVNALTISFLKELNRFGSYYLDSDTSPV